MTGASGGPGQLWLAFALMTVVCWGAYGILLHGGVMAMGDPQHGRFKAFLFVGLAYFVTAVLAPLFLLWRGGASWTFPSKGLALALIAGILGAVGALGVLLAFGAKGSPVVVMSIVFAGAPIVNAATALVLHGGWRNMRWQFMVGILMAALGGCLVTFFKPAPTSAAPTPSAEVASPQR